jgi:hypothetical protein
MVMWGDQEFGEPSIDLHEGWARLPFPKYRLAFAGAQHFDYLTDLPGCNDPRGTCPPMARLAPDLSALFIARHVPGSLTRAHVNDDMTLAPFELTPDQEFYAGSHLTSLRALETTGLEGCSIDMRWQLAESAEEESRRIG